MNKPVAWMSAAIGERILSGRVKLEGSFGAALHAKLRSSGTSVFLVIPWANHAFDAVPFGPSAQLALYYSQRFLAWAMWGEERSRTRGLS